ncbi:neprilysin-1-like isoform X2 [Dermacentor variabilis]
MKKHGEKKHGGVYPEKRERKEPPAPPVPPTTPQDALAESSDVVSSPLAALSPALSPPAGALKQGRRQTVTGQRAVSTGAAAALTGEPTLPLRPLARHGSATAAGKRQSFAPGSILPISLRNSAPNLVGGRNLLYQRADSTASQVGASGSKQPSTADRPHRLTDAPLFDEEESSSTTAVAPVPRSGGGSEGILKRLFSSSGLAKTKSTMMATSSATAHTLMGREALQSARHSTTFAQGYFIPDATPRETRPAVKIVLVIVSALALAIFLCFLLLNIYWTSSSAAKNQCATQACVSYSSLLLFSINQSVDPCESFTRFVCDGWKQKQSLSVRETHFIDALDKLRRSALSARIPATRQDDVQRALALFLSCDDVGRGKSNQLPVVKKALLDAGVVWPDMTRNVDLVYTLLYCSLTLGWGTVLDFAVLSSPSGHTLIVKAGSALPYVIDKIRGFKGSVAKFTYYHTLALAFRLGRERTATAGYYNTTGIEIEALEKLAAHHSAYVVHDSTPSPLQDIVKSSRVPVSDSRWTDCLARIKPKLVGSVNVTTTARLYVAAVLQLWAQLGESRLHFFVSWCTVQVAALYANQELVENYYDKSSSRTRAYHGAFCLSHAMSLSGAQALLSNEGVGDIYESDAGAYARAITSSVREAFRTRLSNWTYFNPNVTVISEWASLAAVFRYVAASANDTAVVPLGQQPDMTTDSFVHNWQKVAQLGSDSAGLATATFYSASKLRYYLTWPEGRDFQFLPYALSFPLFEADMTDALNYGGIGAIVSRALGGLLIDAYAADPESATPVNVLLDCLRGDPFADPGSDDAGIAFGPEAFGLGALVEAYRSVAASDRSLAGLEAYSAMQLLFIALCYNKCEGVSKTNDESLCNVPLRHLPAFAEAFRCNTHTQMNSLHRCHFM